MKTLITGTANVLPAVAPRLRRSQWRRRCEQPGLQRPDIAGQHGSAGQAAAALVERAATRPRRYQQRLEQRQPQRDAHQADNAIGYPDASTVPPAYDNLTVAPGNAIGHYQGAAGNCPTEPSVAARYVTWGDVWIQRADSAVLADRGHL